MLRMNGGEFRMNRTREGKMRKSGIIWNTMV